MSKNRFDGTLKPKKTQAEKSEPMGNLDAVPPADAPRKVGRPKTGSKKENPDYVQATLYLRQATYTDLKLEAVRQGKEISDLAENAIREFLNGKSQ